MNRRGFLAMLGAGAAVTAAGLIVPDVARKIFLPPKGGWTGTGLTESELIAAGLNVGDVLTFGDVYNEQRTHLKQFIVTSIGDSRRVIAQLEPYYHRSLKWA
jgi:hypothetical protein